MPPSMSIHESAFRRAGRRRHVIEAVLRSLRYLRHLLEHAARADGTSSSGAPARRRCARTRPSREVEPFRRRLGDCLAGNGVKERASRPGAEHPFAAREILESLDVLCHTMKDRRSSSRPASCRAALSCPAFPATSGTSRSVAGDRLAPRARARIHATSRACPPADWYRRVPSVFHASISSVTSFTTRAGFPTTTFRSGTTCQPRTNDSAPITHSAPMRARSITTEFIPMSVLRPMFAPWMIAP